MKRIPLTKGYWATVDDEDWPMLMLSSWYAQETSAGVYAARRASDGNGKSHVQLMHRFLMGNPEVGHVDHRDHDTLNNTRDNLRVSTPRQNQGNSRKLKAKTSRFKGVYWLSNRSRWVVDIEGQDGRVRVGSFTDETEAAKAYDNAALQYFGEFACINFPETTLAA